MRQISYNDGVSIGVRGTKTTVQDQVFQSAYQARFSKLEEYKQRNNLRRIDDEAYIVILTIENHSDKTISEISIDVLLEVRDGRKDAIHESIPCSGMVIVPKDLTKEILLLDMSGVPTAYLEIDRINYKKGGQSVSRTPKALQFLIDITMIGNSFTGFSGPSGLAMISLQKVDSSSVNVMGS